MSHLPSCLPTYIGIGAPKAGTTWLAKCLSEHPEVFMAAVKEVEFWKLADAAQRLDEYAAHFHGSEGKRAVGEYSVRYLSLPGVAERIHQTLPQAKLLVALRNPMDQVYSNFWHLHRQNFNSVEPGQAPQNVEDALRTHKDFLLQPARYASNLASFYARFPRTQIHIMFYEEISAEPERVLREVFSFLGVDPAFQPPSTRERGSAVRQGTSPRNPLLGRLHKSVYQGLVNYAYRPLKQLVGTRRAATLKERLRVRPLMEKAFMRTGYPPMDARTRALLRAEFATELSELARLTGRTLTHWQ